eukprot:scaffold149_cov315-Pinguiococcus_pyrenoidosus.AAC.44
MSASAVVARVRQLAKDAQESPKHANGILDLRKYLTSQAFAEELDGAAAQKVRQAAVRVVAVTVFKAPWNP